MTAPFISSADLSAYTGDDIDPGALLTAIAIDSACEAVRTYLEQDVNLATTIEYHDGTGSERLLLRELPIVEITEVIEDDVVLVADEDYALDIYLGVLNRRSMSWSLGVGWPWGWSYGRNNIVITYQHGWAVEEIDITNGIKRVPSDIRIVALQIAAELIKAPQLTSIAPGTPGTGGITSETIGDYSYTVDSSVAAVAAQNAADFSLGQMSDDQKAKLDRYRPGAK